MTEQGREGAAGGPGGSLGLRPGLKIESGPCHQPGANYGSALRPEPGQPGPCGLMSPLAWAFLEEVMNGFLSGSRIPSQGLENPRLGTRDQIQHALSELSTSKIRRLSSR